MQLTQLINFFDISKSQRLIKFAQTPLGKIINISIFCGIFYLIPVSKDWWEACIIIITAISFWPSQRRLWIYLGMLYLLILGTYFNSWQDWHLLLLTINKRQQLPHPNITNLRIVAITLTVVFTEIYIFLVCRYQQYKIMQYPIFNLFILIFLLLAVASYFPSTFIRKAYLWAFIIVFCHYFWYICYTLLECKSFTRQDFAYEYGRYYPIWGGTDTPFPKGSTYLRKIEAKNPEEFAISQLKGIKLMYWACLVYYLYMFSELLQHYFSIPSISEAIAYYSKNQHYSWDKAWACLATNFFITLLYITTFGHKIIAICRMCGYKALRNTYKPLASNTIAEFWNRYYYYFKELLVTVFFYPTYFRFFKTKPKMRIFFATLSAATLGVILFHFLATLEYVMVYGLIKSVIDFHVYMIYALMLGLGIAFSQLYNLGKPCQKNAWQKYILTPVTVIGFYMLLSIFDLPYLSLNIMINIKFLLSLFNIHW